MVFFGGMLEKAEAEENLMELGLGLPTGVSATKQQWRKVMDWCIEQSQ